MKLTCSRSICFITGDDTIELIIGLAVGFGVLGILSTTLVIIAIILVVILIVKEPWKKIGKRDVGNL